MQPTDSFNVTRRTLDVEDYIDILRRHKSWIFGPFLLCVVASVVGVLWPTSTRFGGEDQDHAAAGAGEHGPLDHQPGDVGPHPFHGPGNPQP